MNSGIKSGWIEEIYKGASGMPKIQNSEIFALVQKNSEI